MAKKGTIGAGVALDGEKEFKSALAGINKDLQVLGSEMKKNTDIFGSNAKSQQALTAQSETLEKRMKTQTEKVDVLRNALENAKKEFGENSDKVKNWQIALNRAEGELGKTKNELDNTTKELNQMGDAAQNSGNDLSDMSTKSGTVKVNLFNMSNMAGTAAIAIGRTLVDALKAGAREVKEFISSTMDIGIEFEKIISEIKALSGASGPELQKLTDAALKAGKDTSFSAAEAAEGLSELLKAGLTTEQVLAGGLTGALNLAAAGGVEVADAAEIASTVLNAFRDDALSVTDAANLLAGAANASATDVMGLKLGLSQASAVASGMGLSFADTTTGLAVFAQNGLKGSDAGTSLKTMLMNLQPATDKQVSLFKKLNLMTAEGTSRFYDSTGSMKPLNEIAGILNKSMLNLTDAQRAMALETMFGSDAVRAGNILFKEGSDGVTNMYNAMSKIEAVDVATERLNNLGGSLEYLEGSMDTIKITLFNQVSGPIKETVDVVTNSLNDVLTSIEDSNGDWSTIAPAIRGGLSDAVEEIREHKQEISDLIQEIVELTTAVLIENAPLIGEAGSEIGKAIAKGMISGFWEGLKGSWLENFSKSFIDKNKGFVTAVTGINIDKNYSVSGGNKPAASKPVLTQNITFNGYQSRDGARTLDQFNRDMGLIY